MMGVDRFVLILAFTLAAERLNDGDALPFSGTVANELTFAATESYVYSFAVGDVNNDGYPDVVLGKILLSTGDGIKTLYLHDKNIDADTNPYLFDFYSDIDLRPVRRYVTVLNLWRTLGFEFLINIDHKYPKLRFFRKFWETYLCYVFRGKDMYFEFEAVKGRKEET